MVTGTLQALLEAWDRAPRKLTVRFPQLPLSLCLEHHRRRRWVRSSGLADRHSWSDWQCLRGDWGVTDSKYFYRDSNWRQRHVASFLLLVLLVTLSDPTQSKCSSASQFLRTCCSIYVHHTHSCFYSFFRSSFFHFCFLLLLHFLKLHLDVWCDHVILFSYHYRLQFCFWKK